MQAAPTLAASFLAALLLAVPAQAQELPIDRVIDLNRQAVVDFEAGRFEDARRKLVDAVVLGTKHDLEEHKMMARTHLHLAATVLRQGDRDKARRYLAEAVRIRPDIQPTLQLTSPELEALLAEVSEPEAAAPQAREPAADPAPAPEVTASVPVPPTPQSAPDDADDPLVAMARSKRLRTQEGAAQRRRAGAVFVGLGAGTGYGWHPGQRLEFRQDLKTASAFSPSGDLLALPELGYQLSDELALSVQARLQLITSRGADDPTPGWPARGAFALLVRLQRFIGSGNFHLVASANAGVGDAFRLVLAPRESARLYRHDTVRGGPLALGPGVGAMIHLGRTVALGLEARVLVGAPAFAAVADFGTSFQAAF